MHPYLAFGLITEPRMWLRHPLLHSLHLKTQSISRQHFSSSSVLRMALRDRAYSEEDLDLRPSDREIKEKDLPPNTPTLGQRLERDFDAVFYQRDRKHGYHDPQMPSVWDQIENLTPWELFKKSVRNIGAESKKLYNELTENPIPHLPLIGDVRGLFKFESVEDFDDWKVTTDSYWGEGYSEAHLVKSPTGKALFTGQLSCRIPQDGRTQRAGYVNLASTNKLAAFGRRKMLGWQDFSHLHLKLRGDGRTYKLNVHVYNHFDTAWNDLYTYPLHTRGGPYWQTTVIPFERFILTHQGAVQDHQMSLFHKIADATGLSFTLADGNDGPFALEIDEIFLSLDTNFAKASYQHPYESYMLPHRYFLNR